MPKGEVYGAEVSVILEPKMVQNRSTNALKSVCFSNMVSGSIFDTIWFQNGAKNVPMKPQHGSQNGIESKKRVFNSN